MSQGGANRRKKPEPYVMPEWMKPKPQGPRKYNSRGRLIRGIADELEEQAQDAAAAVGVINIGGRTYDMSLPADQKAYATFQQQELDTQRNRGSGMSDIRGGGGMKPDRTRFPQTPVVTPDTDSLNSLDTASTPRPPSNWSEYEAYLNNKGIQLENSRMRPTGFVSTDLPAGSERVTMETLLQGDGSFNDAVEGAKLMRGDMTTPVMRGIGTGMSEDYRTSTAGMDPQSGASALPDQGDQTRALTVSGADYAPPTSGISARSAAFLDAPMGTGPRQLMQRTNAAQNILRNNGRIAIKDSAGNYNEITQEGYDAIREGMRDNTEFSQDFLKQYMITADKPAEAQSNDSIAPKPASRDMSLENPNAYQFTQNIYAQDMNDMPGFTIDGKPREPLMRFPRY